MKNIGLLFKHGNTSTLGGYKVNICGSGKIKSSHKKINYLRNYNSFCVERKTENVLKTSRVISKFLLLITKVMYSGKMLRDGKKVSSCYIGNVPFFCNKF